MISPEALEKARDAIEENIVMGDIDDDTAVITTGGMLGSIAAALQAAHDAAAPKLPDDLAGLVAELRDAARLNAGPLGPEARAEHRALTAIQSLVARNAELRAEIAALKKEAADVVRPFAENAPPGSGEGSFELPDSHPITFRPDVPSTPSIVVGHFRAARAFLDKWEGRDV